MVGLVLRRGFWNKLAIVKQNTWLKLDQCFHPILKRQVQTFMMNVSSTVDEVAKQAICAQELRR